LVLFIWTTYNGARWWINVPFLPFSLQPVEFMKFWLIIYLAYFLKRRQSQVADFLNGFLPYMFNFGIVMSLLILQPDFWSILICTPFVIAMFFVGWGNIKHLLVSFWVFMIFALSIYWLGKHSNLNDRNSFSYITDRVDNFLADNQNAIQNKTINFQTEQGLIAIGSGGFFGLGFGKSVQKFGYLPEVEGDFIFSVISEELGFLGVFLLVSLYLYIGWRWFLIAEATEDIFGRYVATGITTLLLSQAFINMGVNLNILPLTGITLPFISYGGSSLLSLMLSMWVLLNISRTADYTRIENKVGLFRRNKVR
jgi:cell division protein FtsW